MKKLISFFITVMLLLTTVSAVYADTNAQNTSDSVEKATLKQKLDAVAAKHGGNIVFQDNVAPSNNALKFESVEEFEKALDTLRVVPIENDNNVNNIVSPMAITQDLTADFGLYLSGFEVGGVRNVVKATRDWNATYQRYMFTNWSSQYSYLFIALGASWNQTSSSQKIIDSGRTLSSSVQGLGTLGVQIAGFNVGYTWPVTLYCEWYAN